MLTSQGYEALGPRDFDDEFTIGNIAKQMADMHHLFLTGNRTPVLFKTLKRWLKLARKIKFDDPAMAASLARLDMVGYTPLCSVADTHRRMQWQPRWSGSRLRRRRTRP